MGGSGKGAGLEEGSPLQRERESGVSLPRLQHQPAMQCRCLTPHPSLHPSSLGIGVFLFVCLFFPLWEGTVEADALEHSLSSRGERGSSCFRSISPQPAMGHPALAPATPTQAWPRWFTGGPLQSSRLTPSAPGVLSFPAGPSLPQPRLPSEPPLRSRTHQGWGHRPSFRAASGAKSQDEVGGPQGSLGRASLSGPFGPWPQGGPQSRHRRHLGGGRGRGLHAPRKGQEKSPSTPAGLRWGG